MDSSVLATEEGGSERDEVSVALNAPMREGGALKGVAKDVASRFVGGRGECAVGSCGDHAVTRWGQVSQKDRSITELVCSEARDECKRARALGFTNLTSLPLAPANPATSPSAAQYINAKLVNTSLSTSLCYCGAVVSASQLVIQSRVVNLRSSSLCSWALSLVPLVVETFGIGLPVLPSVRSRRTTQDRFSWMLLKKY